ncbi:MAG: hypothetical protein CMH22_16065 [Methylophaga sp.]|nr:hypothetical protein [Methylophaga sp.]|tara:strand:+ start:15350 stop:15781 length:432 start_codon:yes stop_codon:yes gene_type:complete
MNRAQKRAQAGEIKRRKRLVSQKQYQHYQTNARRWCVGIKATGRHIGGEFEGEWSFPAHIPQRKQQDIATYATHAPLRWRIIARLVLRYDDGSMETREADAEVGQAQIISELQEAREALMRDLERTANGRYVWDKLYLMECLG